jgi:hypothetical protein
MEIEAQIRSYDPAPLHYRLKILSQEYSVPIGDRGRKVEATFIGEMNFGNIMSWIEDHITEAVKTSLYWPRDGKTPKSKNFGFVHPFRGDVSIVELVERYHGWDQRDHEWVLQTEAYLRQAEELGVE